MPTIIENTQQITALAEIEAALSVIESINTISAARGGVLSIQYKPEKGRKVSVNLTESTRGKAMNILTSIKERLSKDVKTKAAKFHISLDENDLACMNSHRKSSETVEDGPTPGEVGEADMPAGEHSGPATAIDGRDEQDADEAPTPQGYEYYDEPELI